MYQSPSKVILFFYLYHVTFIQPIFNAVFCLHTPLYNISVPGVAESELFSTYALGIMDIFLSLFVFDRNDQFCQRLYRLQQIWTIQNTNTSDGWFHWPWCQTERWTEVRQNLMTFQNGIPECETITVCCGMKCSQGAAGYFILKTNHLNVSQTRIVVFILQPSLIWQHFGGFYKVLVIFRCHHTSTKMQNTCSAIILK